MRLPLFLLTIFSAAVALARHGTAPPDSYAAYPGANGVIAFTRVAAGTADIWTVQRDGSGPHNLTADNAFDCCASWSADGSRLAFFSNRSGNNDIWTIKADGSEPRNVSANPADEGRAAISPDGSQVAFGSDRDGDFEVWVSAADGSSPQQLTFNQHFNDFNPAWSPDGSMIAFESNRDGNHEIYVMATDGAAQTNVTDDPMDDGEPDWSPDGKRIAFHSSRTGNFDIFTVGADGSGAAPVTSGPDSEISPAWSPDGTKIAFSQGAPGEARIVVMDLATTKSATITDGGGGSDTDPDWQPRLPIQGDTDCDSGVDSVDGLQVLRENAGLPSAPCIDAGDVDCDSDIDSVDGLGILRYVAGLPPFATPKDCPLIGEPREDPLAGGVLATFAVGEEQFSVWVRNPDTIQQILDLQAGKSTATIPAGPLVAGPGQGDHNEPWSWHLDPDETQMAEVTIELCDGLPSFVEADLDYWLNTVGQFCPWTAELIALEDHR